MKSNSFAAKSSRTAEPKWARNENCTSFRILHIDLIARRAIFMWDRMWDRIVKHLKSSLQLVVLLGILVANPAAADVYKCVAEDGDV